MVGGANTGEPFAIGYVEHLSASAVVPLDGSATIAISITGPKNIYHGLNGNNLPDGVPWIEYFETDIVPSSTLTVNPEDGAYEFDHSFALINGKTYTVTYNGVQYECIV
jgi:hypothetical protein